MPGQVILVQQEKRLLGEIEQVQAKLHRVCSRCGRDPGSQGDDADQAAHIVDLSTDWAFREQWERKLDELRRACSRLRAGQYGICESCGAPIDPARLDLMPQVERCTRCQRASSEQVCRTRSRAHVTV